MSSTETRDEITAITINTNKKHNLENVETNGINTS